MALTVKIKGKFSVAISEHFQSVKLAKSSILISPINSWNIVNYFFWKYNQKRKFFVYNWILVFKKNLSLWEVDHHFFINSLTCKSVSFWTNFGSLDVFFIFGMVEF